MMLSKFLRHGFVLALISVGAISVFSQRVERSIAITIDDLPVVSTRKDMASRLDITKRILANIRSEKIPAIGFVNENKLYADGKLDTAQVDLLRVWLDAGLELGNHTYSHLSLNAIPLADYEADLLRGEKITKMLLPERGGKIRFFRHPYLQTGRTLEVKKEFDAFLESHGYRIAPITFDDSDYIFARAYDNVRDKKDRRLMKRVAGAYLPYMTAKLEYWEKQSVRLFGREMSLTLLIHANSMTAEYLDDLVRIFKKRGYKLVSLETALEDEAYRLPDTFVGGAGISWLHRWALERGKEFIVPNEPRVPEFVMKASGFDSE